jgi:Asp-tRNA(Asn)/Glu-tRNA(Gln) amidotransferase A subunit family amidase
MRCARMRRLGCSPLASGAGRVRFLQCQAALDIREDIITKRRSAKEVVNEFLKRIADREDTVGSFLHVDRKGAFAQVCGATAQDSQ